MSNDQEVPWNLSTGYGFLGSITRWCVRALFLRRTGGERQGFIALDDTLHNLYNLI